VAFLRLAIALQPALHRMALSLQKLPVRERPEIFASQNQPSTRQRMVSIFASASVDCLEVMKMSSTNESKRVRLQNGDRAEPVEIWKARKFIEEHSNEELSLKRVARAVNISRNYLSEKFKEITGVNFVEYVARVRFEKACDLLENADRRISEIAFAVGFQSLSQFNRIFKKLSGRSPTAYRRMQVKRGR
jgi:YesN/AraC family two-component response regulator